MLRSVFFIWVLFSFHSSFAQDTLVVRYDDQLVPTKDSAAPNVGVLVRQGTVWSAMVFDVATQVRLMTGYYAADGTTGEGPFDYYSGNGSRYMHGYYHEGKKVGVWKEWNEQQHLTDSIYFDAGNIMVDTHYTYRRDGSLSSFDFNDHRERHHILRSFSEEGLVMNESEWWGKKGAVRDFYADHSLARLVEYDSSGKKSKPHYYDRKQTEISEADYIKQLKDDEPEFKGGYVALQHYFEKHMRAPDAYRFPNSALKVTVSFMLDEKGKAFHVQVLEYTDMEWQRAAVDFFAGMPNWDMKGHRIWGPVTYSFQLNFN